MTAANSLLGLPRAEFRKLVMFRWTWGAAGVGVLLSAVAAGILAARSGIPNFPGSVHVIHPDVAASLQGQADAGSFAVYGAIIFGVVGGTSEWRYRTWAVSFTARPSRWDVVVVKLLVAYFGGAVIGIASTLAAGGVASAFVSHDARVFQLQHAAGAPTISMLWHAVALAAPGTALACGLLAALWTSIGLLVRLPALAVTGAVAYAVGLRWYLAEAAPNLARWLPEWAVQAFSRPPGSFTISAISGSRHVTTPSAAAGAAAVTAVVIVAAVAAALSIWRTERA